MNGWEKNCSRGKGKWTPLPPPPVSASYWDTVQKLFDKLQRSMTNRNIPGMT